MLIIDELTKLKQRLLNQSSLKEQAFYQFLVNEPLNYPNKNNLTEIEQICLSVFGSDSLSKKELIVAQRKRQPIGGMHYTENLIELSAMAKDNINLEKGNLKSYCENHSTRGFYILNHLFSDILSNPPPPQGVVDQIALYLYKDESPEEGWKPLLLKALYETSDLIDFYVMEQGYLQAMYDNPIVQRTNDIIFVRDTFAQIVAKTESRVKLCIKIVSVLLLGSISYWLFPLIVRNWDQVEPIMAIIEISGSLIFTVVIIVAGFIPDRIKFLNSLRERVIDWVFKRKGFNRGELKETLNRLTNQDEK